MSDSQKRGPGLFIGGVWVDFPFAEPYPAQKQMMSKIMASLKNKENALLESPTGSGKSLALLCSVLAWVRRERVEREGDFDKKIGNLRKKLPKSRNKSQIVKEIEQLEQSKEKCVPKVYYGTRTHRQIKQIIKELKRTAYADVKMTVLGSRQHTCVNPDVKNAEVGITEACVAVVNGKRIKNGKIEEGKGSKKCECAFRAKMEQLKPESEKKEEENGSKKGPQSKFPDSITYKQFTDATGLSTTEPWDIEDLAKKCRTACFCPYFMSKAVKSNVEIIFAPYNYLLDKGIREQLSINLNGQIIMLDEAHNVEDISRKSASMEERQGELRNLQEMALDIHYELLPKAGSENEEAEEAVCTVKRFVNDVITFLETDMIPVKTGQKFKSDQLKVIEFDLLSTRTHEQLWATREKSDELSQAWDKVQGINGFAIDFPLVKSIMDRFVKVYQYMFAKGRDWTASFRVFVKKEEFDPAIHSHLVHTRQKPRTELVKDGDHLRRQLIKDWQKQADPEYYHELQFHCMSPAVAFDDFKHCHSILLASGTLSPLATFEAELEVEFKHKVEANHVIRPEQVFCRHLSSGPSDQTIRAVYSNRDNEKMLLESGKLLLHALGQLARGGVLVFFTSYQTLKNHVFNWKLRKNGIWKELEREGTMYLENEVKGTAEFNFMLEKFNNSCLAGKAILLAVCRGKISEGIDFADDAARIVITIGIPYPAARDPVTKAKMEYNDAMSKICPKSIKGSRWYEIQAFRAINQALGRCLRHSADWGAILLVDERWSGSHLNNISKWLRKMARPVDSFDQYTTQLTRFLDANEQMYKEERERKMLMPPKVEVVKKETKENYAMFKPLPKVKRQNHINSPRRSPPKKRRKMKIGQPAASAFRELF